MKVIAYDKYPDEKSGINYVDKEELFRESDIISIHCPLTNLSKHMINKNSISKMKKGVRKVIIDKIEEFFLKIAEKIGLKKLADWYRAHREGMRYLVFGALSTIVSFAYLFATAF